MPLRRDAVETHSVFRRELGVPDTRVVGAMGGGPQRGRQKKVVVPPLNLQGAVLQTQGNKIRQRASNSSANAHLVRQVTTDAALPPFEAQLPHEQGMDAEQAAVIAPSPRTTPTTEEWMERVRSEHLASLLKSAAGI